MSAHTLCRHCKIEYHAGNIVYCHLHAAAPDMLELLRKAHSRISDDHGIDYPLARDIYDAIMGATNG